MVVDGESICASPGVILLEHDQVIAAGTPQQVGETPGVETEDFPEHILFPALVNAHCHLDLTHMGVIPYTGSFISWIESVREGRAIDEPVIAESVRLGIGLSRKGGTAAVGDIAGIGSLAPLEVMRNEGMAGVSFVEVFGTGLRQQKAIELIRNLIDSNIEDEQNVRLGIQPHAPYSSGTDVFQFATQTGLPLATHLAETLEEIEFIQTAKGDIANLLKRLGVWDDSIKPQELHPIDLLADKLANSNWITAHLNYIVDSHLEILAATNITVAYCPRASAYFGHPHKDHSQHRYREMLEKGINVALGTDSLLCLDTRDRISVLDEMRFLYKRDGTELRTLLSMATIAGAIALGLNEEDFTFTPGRIAGVIAVHVGKTDNPFYSAMESSNEPEWIAGPF